jgi:hypothetical protein
LFEAKSETEGAVYATVNTFPPSTAVARLSWIVVVVGRVTELTVTGVPPTVTVKLPAAATAVARFSLNVKVKAVPFVPNVGSVTVLKSGGVLSTVELFVTFCAAKVTVLFPAASCRARSVVALSDPGEVYATVTVLPCGIAGEKFKTAVEPEMVTLDGTTETPLASTVNADAGAVVALKASLKVRVIVRPVEPIVGTVVDSAGPLVSVPEPLAVTVPNVIEPASLPAAS